MKEIIQQAFHYFRDIRQKIHAYPELRYEEKLTAELVANELSKMGLVAQMGVGKTGVVAILDSEIPGKTIGLRADMDALPLQEATQLSYRSKYPNKMHACGHDGHTATLLFAAHVLCNMKDKFLGKIKFIFQPAEEGGAGAKAMIADGVLENPKIDAIFAYHNHPGYEAGILTTREHCIFNSNTEFTLIIRGKSGHAATQNFAIDPISIGSAIVQNLPNITRQLSEAIDPVILSITRFNSGIANNIIPETATLLGTIRSSTEKRLLAQQYLQNLVHGIAQAYDGKCEIEFKELYPATINTTYETQLVLDTAKTVLGKNKVYIKPLPARASEDFSFFLQKIPGCYFFIGNGINGTSCHNANYDFNDEILPIATEMFCQIAINYLNSNHSNIRILSDIHAEAQ